MDTKISRKERILKEALLLFSTNGYADTSTKLIAQQAEVSEALIFKHFGTKDLLLEYIIRAGYRRILANHKGMLTYSSAKDFLRKMIFLPNKLVTDEPQFWKLQERLSHHPFAKSQHEQFIKPVQPIIHRAFTELGYEEPELETSFMLITVDMLWKKEACGEIADSLQFATLLEGRYQLN